MRLLLDTHAFLWWLADEALTDEARGAIADPSNDVWVSAATIWEISIKRSAGRLTMEDDPIAYADTNGFLRLDMTADHALRAGALPEHHRDPFDRMLVAQAQIEQLALVTRDRRLAAYDVQLIPC